MKLGHDLDMNEVGSKGTVVGLEDGCALCQLCDVMGDYADIRHCVSLQGCFSWPILYFIHVCMYVSV